MRKETAITLFAKHPVKVGGKRRYQEEVVLNDEAVARQLVTDDICKDVNGYFKDATDNEGDDEQSAREKALMDAIASFDPNDTAFWDKDGNPALKKLTQAVGSSVSKEERDRVWALMEDSSHGE